jgi:hypothetical protein
VVVGADAESAVVVVVVGLRPITLSVTGLAENGLTCRRSNDCPGERNATECAAGFDKMRKTRISSAIAEHRQKCEQVPVFIPRTTRERGTRNGRGEVLFWTGDKGPAVPRAVAITVIRTVPGDVDGVFDFGCHSELPLVTQPARCRRHVQAEANAN